MWRLDHGNYDRLVIVVSQGKRGGVRRRWQEIEYDGDGRVDFSSVPRKVDRGGDREVDRGISEVERAYRRRNRVPISLSKVIMMAGELAGYKYGRNGLLSYLTHVAEEDYKTYCSLLGKAVAISERFGSSSDSRGEGKIVFEVIGLSEDMTIGCNECSTIEGERVDEGLLEHRSTSTGIDELAIQGCSVDNVDDDGGHCGSISGEVVEVE